MCKTQSAFVTEVPSFTGTYGRKEKLFHSVWTTWLAIVHNSVGL
jgi:hypothetical protein